MFDFDNIVVLQDGTMVEQGTHVDLLNKNGYYKFLYDQQQQQEKSGIDSSLMG